MPHDQNQIPNRLKPHMEEIITVVDRIQEIYTEAEVIFQVFLNFDKFFRNVQREPIAKAALHA